MATTIVPHTNTSSCRRKRSRAEFDAENIDVMAIGNGSCEQPRKKARTMTANETRAITSPLSSTPSDNIHTSTTASIHTKKRAYSQTEFSHDHAQDEVLKECSPNKKLKTQHAQPPIKMMVDQDSDRDMINDRKEESQEPPLSKMDEEGDVSMEPITKSKRVRHVKRSSSALSFLSSARRRNRDRFPANRVRRSGLQLCVECGIGSSNA
eukprot:915224_1